MQVDMQTSLDLAKCNMHIATMSIPSGDLALGTHHNSKEDDPTSTAAAACKLLSATSHNMYMQVEMQPKFP